MAHKLSLYIFTEEETGAVSRARKIAASLALVDETQSCNLATMFNSGRPSIMKAAPILIFGGELDDEGTLAIPSHDPSV